METGGASLTGTDALANAGLRVEWVVGVLLPANQQQKVALTLKTTAWYIFEQNLVSSKKLKVTLA